MRPVIVRTDFDFRITADPSEWIGQYLYVTARYEEPVSALVARSLQAGDTFVDVGANVGFFTLLAARRVGPAGRVIAFEPMPAAQRALRRNVQLNAFENVEIRAEAAAEAAGEAVLFLGPEGHTSASSLCEGWTGTSGLTVALTRADDAIPAGVRVRLVKIDAEGAELRVLRGMTRLLREHEPDLVVEVNSQDVLDHLRALGYGAYTLGRDSMTPLTQLGSTQANVFFSKKRP